jgi:hypothetical protein
VLLATNWPAIITAFSALITACGGILMAYSAVVRARQDKEDECIQKLKEARKESEEMYAKLHEIRTGKKPTADEHLDARSADSALDLLTASLRKARERRGGA